MKALEDPFTVPVDINESRQPKSNLGEYLGNGKSQGWQKGQSGNPKGTQKGSIAYWYKTLLAENEGITAKEIAQKTIELAKSGLLPHTIEVTDRTDGKVASEVHLKGLIVHVGDEYAQLGLDAVTKDLEDRRLDAANPL